MSEKKCCSVDVVETEKGLRVELTGERIKECLSSLLSCCSSKAKAADKSR